MSREDSVHWADRKSDVSSNHATEHSRKQINTLYTRCPASLGSRMYKSTPVSPPRPLPSSLQNQRKQSTIKKYKIARSLISMKSFLKCANSRHGSSVHPFLSLLHFRPSVFLHGRKRPPPHGPHSLLLPSLVSRLALTTCMAIDHCPVQNNSGNGPKKSRSLLFF